MNISEFALYLKRLDETASRLAITEILADLFAKSKPLEIKQSVYLLLGSLAPRYDNLVFNMADKMVIRAVATACGVEDQVVVDKFRKSGDLGQVVFDLRSQSKAQKTFLVSDIFEKLTAIAKDNGEGSVERKIDEVGHLLSQVDALSAKYITRMVLGKLRLGFSDKTIIDALSWMLAGDKSKSSLINKAYEVIPDVGFLAERVQGDPSLVSLSKLSPQLGIPVLPMLAARLRDPADIIKKMGMVGVEPKIDGLRLQVHYSKTAGVWGFTRNLNEISDMFPELQKIATQLSVSEVILDCEAIGVDEVTRKMADFQTTMTRRRKYDILEKTDSLPVTFNVFDVLMVDGQNQMTKSYQDRKQMLEKIVSRGRLLKLVKHIQTDKPQVILAENKKQRKLGYEGILLKKIDSRYVSGRLGWRWVKMKEDQNSAGKLSDTVDCVVMGYSVGKGKRAGFGIGKFLAGVRDGEKVLTITKVGTGLTDAEFKTLNNRLEKLTVDKKPKEYGKVDKLLEPDYWVTPDVVVELAADDLTKSPNHSSGYALRFPRLVKFRPDKSWKQATTVKELRSLL